jgi:hypothetical protein
MNIRPPPNYHLAAQLSAVVKRTCIYWVLILLSLDLMQVDGKMYKVIFLETITECNMKIKQYSCDMYKKNFCLIDMWDFICFTNCKVTSKNLKKVRKANELVFTSCVAVAQNFATLVNSVSAVICLLDKCHLQYCINLAHSSNIYIPFTRFNTIHVFLYLKRIRRNVFLNTTQHKQ